MTQEDKLRYFKMAASFNNMGFTTGQVDLLVSMYEVVMQKKGKTSIDDMVRVQFEVKDREIERKIEEENRKTKKDE